MKSIIGTTMATLGIASATFLAGVAVNAPNQPTVTPVSPIEHVSHQVRDLPNWVTRPCPKEGSVNCRWIATGPRAQGNGHGHTYIVRQVPGKVGMVCQFYVQPAYARHHDYCS